jgi:hypothetical protein
MLCYAYAYAYASRLLETQQWDGIGWDGMVMDTMTYGVRTNQWNESDTYRLRSLDTVQYLMWSTTRSTFLPCHLLAH